MASPRVPPPPDQPRWAPAALWTDAEWSHWLTHHPLTPYSPAEIAQYLIDRQRYGFGVQVRRGQPTWLYQPGPNGVKFHADPTSNLLFGGAAGGMKSYTIRWDAHMRAHALPGARLLILRRTFQQLIDNHLDAVQREVQRMADIGLDVTYYKDDKRVVYRRKGAEDSWLRFGHCEREGDEEQYLSNEYEAIYPDEMGTFTQRQILGVASRLRSAIPGVRPLLKGGSNPAGSQTLWLKRWFIDHDVTPEEDPTYDPAEWGFLPSKLYDNPFLMDADGTWTTYEKRLSATGPERRRQLLEGDWSAIEGQFFAEWRTSTHVRDLGAIGPDVERFRSMDWGYLAPTVCYWWACLPDGRYYLEDELKCQGMLATDVALAIQKRTQQLSVLAGGPIRIRYTAADPSMWNRSGDTGESLAETFARTGVPLRKAQHDRVNGWGRTRALLAVRPDGQGGQSPGLIVSPRCTYLIQTLPTLVHDTSPTRRTDGEDLDTSGQDHGADALRYGAMSRPSPTRASTTPVQYGPHTLGALRRDIERDNRRRFVA